ncbi:MAG TPA: NAD+ synthase [Steroidobacteraceae bacterium]|nr:NAD+ synthase [Steroidobacteraceae bacterium]
MNLSAPKQLRCVMAQLNLVVGDVDGNTSRIVAAANEARDRYRADIVMLPELAVSGYPPEDLLFHSGMRLQVARSLERLKQEVRGITLIAGYPEYAGAKIFNSAIVIRDGSVLANHRKACLPNYRVFDEKRYFTPGTEPTIIDVHGVKAGVLVCEDVWDSSPAQQARQAGAQVLLVINASPYEVHKQTQREQYVVRERVREAGVPVVFVNLVGGQDELVFDGNSFVMDALGDVTQRAPAFTEGTYVVDLSLDASGTVHPIPADIAPLQGEEESVYGALVQGTHDYVTKHRFPGVVMGLSGGIDSALTLVLAVDALGADHVHSVAMPSRYTSQMSKDDAALQAKNLHVKHSEISIEGMFEATLAALKNEFAGLAPDTAEENIQSRCRGVLLMGISNKTGKMLLTTGNKSEMAVGYATLYGDMAGGFAPIKDCSKLLVYRLARWRNAQSEVIPPRVIDRPPSAELRFDQKDTDSLPPYEILDPILEAFIEEDLSVDQIAARGFDRATVGRILDLVKRNEYKRRQAPPGVRVSGRAFGRDWRYPITSGYKSH